MPALSLASAAAAPGGAELQKAQHVAAVSAPALAGGPAQAVSWHLAEPLGRQIFPPVRSSAFSSPGELNERHLPVRQHGHLSKEAFLLLATITVLKAKTTKRGHPSIQGQARCAAEWRLEDVSSPKQGFICRSMFSDNGLLGALA